MTDLIKNAFDDIYAEDKLKRDTIAFLQKEIGKQKKTGNRILIKRYAAVFASAILIFVSGMFSYRMYFTPIAYVDMDVNPSVELSVNRFDRVIGALAYNEDGESILQEVKVRYKTYEEAVGMLLEEMMDKAYLPQEGLVSLTVQTGKEAEEKILLERLQITVSQSLGVHHSSAESEIYAVTQEIRQNAHQYNVSPAKYIAITKLQEVDQTVTFDGCAGHTIKEIRELTKNHGCEKHGGRKHNRGHD